MKLKHTLIALATTSSIASAATIFSSDFEADAVASPAPDTLADGWFFDNTVAGNADGVTGNNEHRIFDGPAAGGGSFGSRGWISNVANAYITVDLGPLSANTIYTVDYFAGAETSRTGNNILYLAELLVGTDVNTATTVASDSGNDAGDGGGKNADEMHSFSYTSLAANPGDNIYLKLERDGGSAFIFYDDVVVDATAVPEPSSTALLGLGSIALLMRRKK